MKFKPKKTRKGTGDLDGDLEDPFSIQQTKKKTKRLSFWEDDYNGRKFDFKVQNSIKNIPRTRATAIDSKHDHKISTFRGEVSRKLRLVELERFAKSNFELLEMEENNVINAIKGPHKFFKTINSAR